MTRRRVVVVGAGHAAFHFASTLRGNGFDGELHVVGDEPDLPYQRPPLSKTFLKNDVGPVEVAFRPSAFYADHAIELHLGARAVAVDRAQRRLALADGTSIGYDHLVLATGSVPYTPPFEGTAADGIVTLRTVTDAVRLRARLGDADRVLVVGGGFIGLEVAATAAALGHDVVVVELADRLMSRLVSTPVSGYFRGHHAALGNAILLRTKVVRLDGADGGYAAELSNGDVLHADLVMTGVGSRANDVLAAEAGLPVADGVIVDDLFRTADPAIFAIGDCARFSGQAEHPGQRLESVQNAVAQSQALAAALAGRARPARVTPWFWSDQGSSRLQIVGLAGGDDVAVLRGNLQSGRFSVFRFAGGRLVACESVNAPADHIAARRLLDSGTGIGPREAADPDFDLKVAARRPAASVG